MISGFKYFKTGYSVDQVPDLTGKVALVTGGNTGLGLETVRQLAKKGARVFMGSRSEERAKEALEQLKAELGEKVATRVEFLRLDLQDLKQVRNAAEAFLDKGLPLHILVNNAGIMACPFGLTKDGIESQMGTNHVGHFALTMALLPALQGGPPSRVVNVSGEAYMWSPKGGILLDRINDEPAMDPWQRYGQSKLANILFTRAFHKRHGSTGVYATALHPGVVHTELGRGPRDLYGLGSGWKAYVLAPLLQLVQRAVTLDTEKGALTQIYCATSPTIEDQQLGGKYFLPYGHVADDALTETAQDAELERKLWEWTEKVVSEKLGKFW